MKKIATLTYDEYCKNYKKYMYCYFLPTMLFANGTKGTPTMRAITPKENYTNCKQDLFKITKVEIYEP